MAIKQLPRLTSYAGMPVALKRWADQFAGDLERLAVSAPQSGWTATPAGAASGDLGGTYPSPILLTISNATVPGSNITGKYQIYVDGADNKLKVRGPSGTITILASP